MSDTGSAVYGTLRGLGDGLNLVAGKMPSTILFVNGNPSGIVPQSNGAVGSDVAFDVTGNKLYMSRSGTTGTLWINVGSTT